MFSSEERKMANILDEYPVTVELPVVWGDMDAFQHVNNVVYIRYFESVRVAYCERLGYMRFLEEHGVGPILGSIQCLFKIPLTYPDHVTVGARVIRVDDDRFTMEHLVVSKRLGKVAARGDGILVNFDYRHNQKAALPKEIYRAIENLEGRSLSRRLSLS